MGPFSFIEINVHISLLKDIVCNIFGCAHADCRSDIIHRIGPDFKGAPQQFITLTSDRRRWGALVG